MRVNKERHYAFKCDDCHTVNLFPIHRQDGNCCHKCGGYLHPIGEAIIVDRKSDAKCLTIDIRTNGLQELCDKLNEINNLAAQAKESIEALNNTQIPPVE